MAKDKVKPPKRVKPTKAKVKQFLLANKHKNLHEIDDYIDMIALAHNVDPEELRRLIEGA